MYHFQYKCHTFIFFGSPASNTHQLNSLVPRMRKLIVTSVFLTCLLLSASQHRYFSTKVMVQAIGSGSLLMLSLPLALYIDTCFVAKILIEIVVVYCCQQLSSMLELHNLAQGHIRGKFSLLG